MKCCGLPAAIALTALAVGAPHVRVLVFVRTDCPITNRYAPELARIAQEFPAVDFSLVYPDPATTLAQAEKHLADFRLPGKPVLDPHHEIVRQAHATTAPEAAVFDAAGKLAYHGRIDDLWIDAGKARSAAHVHDLEDAIQAVLAGKPVAHPETKAVGCSLADVQ